MTSPVAAFLVLLAAGCVACGSGSDRPGSQEVMAGNPVAPGPGTASDIPPPGDDVATGACNTGESRDCRVWLPEVNGIKNCFVGTQVCVDDEWSNCLSDENAAELLGE